MTMKNKTGKDYTLESTYLVLCYQNLKNSLKYLRTKLRTLAITENIPTDLNPKTLKLLENQLYQLIDSVRNSYIFKDDNARKIASRILQLKLNKHSESDGSTTRNFYNKSAISIYIKNKRQFISKLSRTTKGNFPNLVRSVEKAKHIDFHENTIRLEITMFNYSKILQKEYYDLLQDLKKFILELIKQFKNKELKKAFTPIFKFNSEFRSKVEEIFVKWFDIPPADQIFDLDKPPNWLYTRK